MVDLEALPVESCCLEGSRGCQASHAPTEELKTTAAELALNLRCDVGCSTVPAGLCTTGSRCSMHITPYLDLQHKLPPVTR